MSSPLIAAINNLNNANAPSLGSIGSSVGGFGAGFTGWLPPNWSKSNFPIWTLTVPPSSQPTPFTPSLNYGLPVQPIVYVFDAILRSDHEEGIRMTEFPVQTGSNISDNAYILQSRVTLEIGMSDVMASYYTNQWTGGGSGMMQTKSVAAYNVLCALKDARQFVTLATRVKIYPQMVIERITISDTVNTLHGLRAQVTFRQVFVASVTVGQLSPTAQTSSTAGSGTAASTRTDATLHPAGSSAQTAAPSANVAALFQVTPTLPNDVTSMQGAFGPLPTPTPGADVPGAGGISSVGGGQSGGLTVGPYDIAP